MKIFYNLIFILFLLSLLAPANNAQEYAGTSAKDFCADAPWRVKSFDSKIPIILTIKDADSDNCLVDTVQIWVFDKINNRDSPILRQMFGGLNVNSKRWDYLFEVSVNDLNSSPFNFSINEFDTLSFRVKLSFRDNIIPEYFTQYLTIFVGNGNFPIFENWYSGDAHFHSEFTNNLYEFGSTIRVTSKAASALGLDWLTITDHSCDFPPVGVGFNALLDSINLYNLSSSCLMIRGEEVTIDNNNVNNSVDDKIHLLVYNKNLFIRGPENYFTFTNDNSGNLTLLSSALTQNVNGIAYASHPFDDIDISFGGSLIGNLVKWSPSNFNEALSFRGNFRGLEFWNTKELFTKNVDDTSINPFPFNQNSENKLLFYKSHLASAESSWCAMLINDLNNFSPEKKLFGLGGSDAHGDFNYQTYGLLDINASNNAFAKVRTLAYLPNGKSTDNILLALKNGNTILSDGPALLFDIDMNGDEIIESDFITDAHIGGDKIVNYSSIDSNKTKILLRWKNTNEFGGNIKRFILHYITKNIKREFLLNGHFGIVESQSGSTWISLKDLETTFGFNYSLDEYALIKFAAYTQDSLFRCYTNPIWLKIESPVGINIKLTALIEGFFESSTQSMTTQDTLLVELRSSVHPFGIVDSARILIDTFGKGTAQFKSANTGDYYIIVRHRNSIETWSKAGGEHFVKGTITSYDFTIDSSRAFGDNLKKIGNKWCIFSGDVNQDGLIDTLDIALIQNDAIPYSSGYLKTDLTGDNFADLNDLTIGDNNTFMVVTKIVPNSKSNTEERTVLEFLNNH